MSTAVGSMENSHVKHHNKQHKIWTHWTRTKEN